MKRISVFIKANSFFLKSAWKKHKSYYFIYALNIAFTSFHSILFVNLPRIFLKAVLDERDFIRGISYIIGAILYSLFYAFWERKAFIRQNLNLTDILLDLKGKVYDKIVGNNMLSFEDNEYYNSITKALAYTETGGDSVIKLCSDFIATAISLIGISYIIAIVNPFVVVLLVAVIILAHFFMKKTNNMWFEYQQNERLPRVRLNNYLANMFLNKNFVSEIQINNGIGFMKEVLLGNSMENARYEAKKDAERFRWNFAAIALNSVQELISYIYFGYLLFTNAISIATYSSLFAAVQQFTADFNQLLNMSIDFSNKVKEANLYMEFLNDDRYIRRGIGKSGDFDEIRFTDVKFAYPGQGRNAIDNISIKIRKGEKIAIVGRNGSGKTTFTKLLTGLFPPTEGRITINGMDFSDMDMDSWFSQVSAAMQEPFHLPMEIQKNITFSFDYDKERMERALDSAGILKRIQALPDKWDSILTKQFSKAGVDLSGGEKQKLALARAFYKDCRLLIFDEPSSALDPESEYELFRNIQKIEKDKTVIYISHRLSTTVGADKIIVFDEGAVVEVGNHNELMKNNKLYAELFNKQAENYIGGTEND